MALAQGGRDLVHDNLVSAPSSNLGSAREQQVRPRPLLPLPAPQAAVPPGREPAPVRPTAALPALFPGLLPTSLARLESLGARGGG